jgi:hypothetical protein
MTVQIIEGIEVNLPDDMKVVRRGDARGDAIIYRDHQITLAGKDYKPDLRPGPFFVYDASAHLLEFDTLGDCRAFIDKI